MEKHIETRKDVYHNFIYFKKEFDRVWDKGLWQSMENCWISQEIIDIIKLLYDNSSSAVLINNITEASSIQLLELDRAANFRRYCSTSS